MNQPAQHHSRAGLALKTFPASALAPVDVPTPSEVVRAEMGTGSVAEAAAILAAGTVVCCVNPSGFTTQTQGSMVRSLWPLPRQRHPSPPIAAPRI